MSMLPWRNKAAAPERRDRTAFAFGRHWRGVSEPQRWAWRRHRVMNRLSNLQTTALCSLLLLAGCSGSSEPTRRVDLEEEFQAEFGIQPSSRITDIRCKTVHVGDAWRKWMRFTLDGASLERIVSNGFSEASTEQLNRPWGSHWQQDLNAQNPNAPNWWRTPGTNQARVYYREPNRKDFGGSSMYIWIDDMTKTVYSNSSAWD